MRSAKALAGCGIVAASVLGLAACAGGGTPEQQTDDIDLRMTVWTSNEEHLDLFDSIADEYMADHPEISSITFDPLPFEDYTSTVTTQMAGGEAPDLVWILENSAPDFVESGALLPLDDTLKETEGYEYDDLSEAATELWRDDDGLVAYPFSTSPFVMFTNEDLLAEAGLPAGADMKASGDWNWDAVSDAGATVAEKTGQDGFVVRDFEYLTWDLLASVWNGWGATPWSDDGATCTFTEPEMVEAMQFLHDAAFEKGSMPGPGTTADFFAGEAAFTVTQISRASELDGSFDWDLLPLPEGPAGEYAMVGQGAIGVIADSPRAEAAADFLAYFTNPTNSEKLAQYFPPPRDAQINAETLAASNPTLSKQQLEDVVVPAIETGVVRPVHSDQAKISQEARAAMDSLWTPKADVEKSMDGICSAIDPLLGG